MKKSLLILVTFWSSLTNFTFGQNQDSCRAYFTDKTKLTYADNSEDFGVVTIKGNFFIEEFHKSDIVVKSRYEWLTACSFKLTIVKIKGSNSILKVGQSITIVVTKIEGNKAYYNYDGMVMGGVKYYTKLDQN